MLLSKGLTRFESNWWKVRRIRNRERPQKMEQPIWNFEQYGSNEPGDESSVNLRAYFDRMPDEKMQQYSPSWSAQQLMEWDGNFKNDGELLLPCSERDVEVGEYRAVLEECIKYRNRECARLKQGA